MHLEQGSVQREPACSAAAAVAPVVVGGRAASDPLDTRVPRRRQYSQRRWPSDNAGVLLAQSPQFGASARSWCPRVPGSLSRVLHSRPSFAVRRVAWVTPRFARRSLRLACRESEAITDFDVTPHLLSDTLDTPASKQADIQRRRSVFGHLTVPPSRFRAVDAMERRESASGAAPADVVISRVAERRAVHSASWWGSTLEKGLVAAVCSRPKECKRCLAVRITPLPRQPATLPLGHGLAQPRKIE